MAKSGAYLDARRFLQGLDLADDRTKAAALHQLRLNALHLEGEAKKLAPLAEGTLSGSGGGKVSWYPRTTHPRWKGERAEAAVGFNAPYAAEVHETMLPAIGAKRRPGFDTRNKPPTKFGEAGGKYLERPLRGMMREYTKRIADAVKRRLR